MRSPIKQLIAILCLAPAALTATAKEQAPGGTNGTADQGPLQIQEQPASGMMPTPSVLGPDSGSFPSSADTNSTPVTPVPADTNASSPSVPADTNAAVPAASDSNAPAANSGMGSPGQNPPPSDPNSLIPPPAEPEQPSPINAAGNGEKQRQEQKTRYYTAKTQADKEEALASLQAKADKAKSDEAKRQTLREYYDLLAKRMKKIDPSISDWIDTMHAAYLRRLAQVRVEPTVAVNVPPAPEGEPSPSPTPKKKKHRSQPAE